MTDKHIYIRRTKKKKKSQSNSRKNGDKKKNEIFEVNFYAVQPQKQFNLNRTDFVKIDIK